MEKVQKKKGRKFKVLSLFVSFLLLVFGGVFVYLFYQLDLLPSAIMIPSCIMMGLVILLFVFLLMIYTKKWFTKLIAFILVLALALGTGFGDYYLIKTQDMMSTITSNVGQVKNTVSIISLSSSGISSLEDLNSKNVAELKNIDQKGTEKLNKAVQKELDLSGDSYPYTIVEANSVQEMVNSLYDESVDAIVLNESYRTNVKEMDSFTDFDSRTTVVYQATYYTKSANEALAVSDITTEPFMVLISGKDAEDDVSGLSRSDVNMVVVVNPLTSTIFLLSIPRDMYINTVCSGEDACYVGGMDKITHTGIYGISTTKATIEEYLGININYTFEVNYKSVIDIVDALGGIDIEIEPGMAVSKFYSDSSLEGVVEGWNHLDGARALAFARERHAYLDGDNQRVRNQQKVLQAIFNKATSSDIITGYASLMEALSSAFATNMSSDEITDLIKYQIQTMTNWTFESYQISGYGDMLVCASLGSEASVTVPYEGAATIAHDKIVAVLNGQSSYTVEDTLNATESSGALSSEEIEAQINEAISYGYEETYTYDYYEEPTYVEQDVTYEEQPVVEEVPESDLVMNPYAEESEY